MIVVAVIVIVALLLVVVLPLGLFLALRHQRRYNEQLAQGRPGVPLRAPPPPALRAAAFDPHQVVDVTEQQLRDDPAAYHQRSIRVTATWVHRFECSKILEAWVVLPSDTPVPDGEHRVRVEGVWVFPRPVRSTAELPGFGHLGMSWGELRVHSITRL